MGTGGQALGNARRGSSRGAPSEWRDGWPRDFGRDGVSGLVTLDRAMRARDVSRPGPDDEELAVEVLADLMARVDGRRPSRTSA